jgi:hypothetical protein
MWWKKPRNIQEMSLADTGDAEASSGNAGKQMARLATVWIL